MYGCADNMAVLYTKQERYTEAEEILANSLLTAQMYLYDDCLLRQRREKLFEECLVKQRAVRVFLGWACKHYDDKKDVVVGA